IIKGQTRQLTATATFSNKTSSDITRSVSWKSFNTAIATVSSTGLLSGVEVGNTTLTAMKDDVTSNTVDVNVHLCTDSDLADACIDIFDAGAGKLFTNSPSEAYLQSIGGSSSDGHTEDGTLGPAGDFSTFDMMGAGQALCNRYNTVNLDGRTNWRVATKDELIGLPRHMFSARGWPTSIGYWSTSPGGIMLDSVSLDDGFVATLPVSAHLYVSCVSENR
ncbi:TPA: Ig-like domain-containing protein, partial [Photobacterium damselae]